MTQDTKTSTVVKASEDDARFYWLDEGRTAGGFLREIDHSLYARGTHPLFKTPVDNVAAIKFYKRKEYFVEKTIPGYYSNQLDALVMSKDLVVIPVN